MLNVFIFIIEDAFIAAKLMVWGDMEEKYAKRKPFDLNELFEVMTKRNMLSQKNLQEYYRQRRGARPSRSTQATANESAAATAAAAAAGKESVVIGC